MSAWALPAARPLDEVVWRAWVAKGRAQDKRRKALGIKVLKLTGIVALLAAAGFSFRLGAASPAGVDLSQVKVIHSRSALIQELDCRTGRSFGHSQGA
jgi:hypothetical protein